MELYFGEACVEVFDDSLGEECVDSEVDVALGEGGC